MPDTPEAHGPKPPEILKPDDHSGFYGRLLLASQKPAADAFEIMRPENLPPVNKADVDLNAPRRYNHITSGISLADRTEAWESIPDFDLAYPIWQRAFANEIRSTTSQKRLDVLSIIAPGIQAASFTEADARKLFEDFCNSESDIDSFLARVTQDSSLRKGNHINSQKIEELSESLEWMSRMLFGERTAPIISRIMELETKISNKPKTIVGEIFHDPESINNINRLDLNSIHYLYDGYKTQLGEEPARRQVSAVQTSQSYEPEETEDAEPLIQPIVPEPPHATNLTTPDLPQSQKLPDFLEQKAALAETLMVADVIERLAAEGLVAAQISAKLADHLTLTTMDEAERKLLIRAVIAKRSIITKDEPGFVDWQSQYLTRPTPIRTPETQPKIEDELVAPVRPKQHTTPDQPQPEPFKVPEWAVPPTKPFTDIIKSGTRLQHNGDPYSAIFNDEERQVILTNLRTGETSVRDPNAMQREWDTPYSGWATIPDSWTPSSYELVQSTPVEPPAVEPEPTNPRIKIPMNDGIVLQKDGVTYEWAGMDAQKNGRFRLRNTRDGKILEISQQQLNAYLNAPNPDWIWLNASDFGVTTPTTPPMETFESNVPAVPENHDAIQLGAENFAIELNAGLKRNSGAENLTFEASIDSLKSFLLSSVRTGGNRKLDDEGTFELDIPNNQITLKHLVVKSRVGKGFIAKDVTIDMDISLTNQEGNIGAVILRCKPDIGLLKGPINDDLAKLNDTFRQNMDQQIAGAAPDRRTGKIAIVGDKISMEFYKMNSLS